VEHPAFQTALDKIPITMPRDPGSLGLDMPLWVGLGLVGLWSALDAFSERAQLSRADCPTCGRKCLARRMVTSCRLDATNEKALEELDDMRHLFAHNYAGRADAKYFDPKRSRHVLRQNDNATLLSGAVFDGASISLTAAHLRYYAEQSREIL